MSALDNKNILLVISGGIAAYKSLELIRLIRKAGGTVRCILTGGGSRFVTPMSVSALSENPVYTELWSLKDENEMGHIRLSREADLIVIAPTSANLLAKMAHGLADDLASTMLLAADKPVLMAPAMNHMMWSNPATQENIRILEQRGVTRIGPAEGDMACGEHGPGRMAEPGDIFHAITRFFAKGQVLSGLRALVTAGPTFEPIDPVRFLGNRSSGKQGYAIAQTLAARGADVTLISGPVSLPDPPGVRTVRVETAMQMLAACQAALPTDIAICAAAVSDWTPDAVRQQKLKKQDNSGSPAFTLKENPDILKTLAQPGKNRPQLVIGFAAETENLLENAGQKLKKKGCDWIIGNDVSTGSNIFGGDHNHVYLITATESEEWPRTGKQEIAGRLADRITAFFGQQDTDKLAAE